MKARIIKKSWFEYYGEAFYGVENEHCYMVENWYIVTKCYFTKLGAYLALKILKAKYNNEEIIVKEFEL